MRQTQHNLSRSTGIPQPRRSPHEWERDIIDVAMLYGDAVNQIIGQAFRERLRALWVVDATPAEKLAALENLRRQMTTAVNRAYAATRREVAR